MDNKYRKQFNQMNLTNLYFEKFLKEEKFKTLKKNGDV